jgi:hypothetical protein
MDRHVMMGACLARSACKLAALTLAIAASLGAMNQAQAQGPREPLVPNMYQRSGLLTRFTPITPHLPPDPDRDEYHLTRWDAPDVDRPNHCRHGGLYGLVYRTGCTKCNWPNFQGSPGVDSIGPECIPGHPAMRWLWNVAHPWRPVGSYYAGGAHVPVYDLDPLVTGPGPYPWPVFFKRPTGG